MRWQLAEAVLGSSSAASFDERSAELAEIIRPLVAAEEVSARIAVVFDLDHTLWMGRCEEWSADAIKPLSSTQVNDSQTSRILDLPRCASSLEAPAPAPPMLAGERR